MNLKNEMYQEIILDHNKSPHHFHKLAQYTHHSHGDNPVCGDSIDIYLNVVDNKIEDISFTGEGCAICKASASMMTDALINKEIKEATNVFDAFHKQLTTEEVTDKDTLKKLVIFENVKKYPIRVKCATLPWHTFLKSLSEEATND